MYMYMYVYVYVYIYIYILLISWFFITFCTSIGLRCFPVLQRAETGREDPSALSEEILKAAL